MNRSVMPSINTTRSEIPEFFSSSTCTDFRTPSLLARRCRFSCCRRSRSLLLLVIIECFEEVGECVKKVHAACIVSGHLLGTCGLLARFFHGNAIFLRDTGHHVFDMFISLLTASFSASTQRRFQPIAGNRRPHTVRRAIEGERHMRSSLSRPCSRYHTKIMYRKAWRNEKICGDRGRGGKEVISINQQQTEIASLSNVRLSGLNPLLRTTDRSGYGKKATIPPTPTA